MAPRDVAIIVPYLDGALRYMLTNACARPGCPSACCAAAPAPREERASAPGSRGWRWLIPAGVFARPL